MNSVTASHNMTRPNAGMIFHQNLAVPVKNNIEHIDAHALRLIYDHHIHTHHTSCLCFQQTCQKRTTNVQQQLPRVAPSFTRMHTKQSKTKSKERKPHETSIRKEQSKTKANTNIRCLSLSRTQTQSSIKDD